MQAAMSVMKPTVVERGSLQAFVQLSEALAAKGSGLVQGRGIDESVYSDT